MREPPPSFLPNCFSLLNQLEISGSPFGSGSPLDLSRTSAAVIFRIVAISSLRMAILSRSLMVQTIEKGEEKVAWIEVYALRRNV